MLFRILLGLLFVSCFSSISGHNQGRFKVLELDVNGNLYLQKTLRLFVNDIIKRLSDGTYSLAESGNLGLSKDFAALTCQDLKLKVPSVQTGVYWIDPDGGSHGNAFQAYCDQQTASGGWTLVYSYTFTDYSTFTRGTNAVTPRPSWTTTTTGSRVSTTVPLSETHYEAMNFALWRTIGKEFLIKSNINNWIACKEGTGSLVQQKAGSITCKMVKQVAKQCGGVVPKFFRNYYTFGPSLDTTSHYYFFDSNTRVDKPYHDPCGKGLPNHLKGVANPHGSIFVR